MKCGFKYKNEVVVGLIIMFALLFFCGWDAIKKQHTEETNKTEDYDSSEEQTEEQVRKVDPDKPMIALTFDDGPSKFTMQILEQLEAHDARATFFMVGNNVGRYPDEVRKMKEIGCELGNHSMNHARLTELENDGISSEISGTNEAVSNVVGERTSLLRPPYGAVDDKVSGVADAPVVLWSVDTRDWEVQDATVVTNHILENVKDGDIVLMHDIYDTTVQAAMEFIPQLIERGYQLVTVSEMAEARGITLENGVRYSRFYKK